MADAKTSASVVVVDAKSAAEARDRLAREQLMKQNHKAERETLSFTGIECKMPYSLKVSIDPHSSSSCEASVGNSVHLKKIKQVLSSGFEMCAAHLNEFEPSSEISKVNSAPVGQKIDLSDHLTWIFSLGVRTHRASGGAFDLGFVPLLEYLKEIAQRIPAHSHSLSHSSSSSASPASGGDGNGGGKKRDLLPQVMTEQEHAKALQISHDMNFDHAFIFDENAKTITKKRQGGKCGISAIAKGYTVDFVIESLIKAGYENCLFEWSGDVRAAGTNEHEKPWSVGVVSPPSLQDMVAGHKPHQDPSSRRYLRTCVLQDAAIATSGDYEYHLLGQVTSLCLMKDAVLLEARDDFLAQVSVSSTSCAVADVLATTLLLKRTISNARWWIMQWRSVRHPILDYTFYVRHDEVVARKHEIAAEAPEVRAARIRDNLPARVIVVGGGLAGLSAAIEAASCGASVVIMEKAKSLGGNSAKATSGINGWGTRMQGAKNIEDDGRFFERDTFKSGMGGICDVALVKTLSVRSRDAIHWLASNTHLNLGTVAQLGGHSRPRTHRIPDTAEGEPVPVGYTIMARLKEKIERDYHDKITIMTNTTVTELIAYGLVGPDHVRRVRVSGVRFRQGENRLASGTPSKKPAATSAAGGGGEGGGGINNPGQEEDETEEGKLLADAVILTTGGFSNDHSSDNSLLSEYAPDLVGVPTTNGPFATGDGVKMAREIGATLQDMDKVQLHPTGFIDPAHPSSPTKYLGPEALRGSGGILLAPGSGERFVNELGLRSHVSAAIKALGNEFPGSNGLPYAFCVLNRASVKLFGPAQLGFYRDKVKLFRTAHSIAELAQIIGCNDVQTLTRTLQNYSKACKNGRCAKTGKSVFPCPWNVPEAAVSNPNTLLDVASSSSSEFSEGPYEVAVVTPCIHYTMGGIAISSAAEVQVVDHSPEPQLGRARPIRGLFAAGEVTSGVHGANRLGGNSLLECVVFGRIAGDRAASILQRHAHALNQHSWTSVTVREVREGTEFGRGARIIRFNFPGAMQPSGLHVGQFVSLRGEWLGKQLLGHYSPITLPNDIGVIGLLVRVDKGPLAEWLSALQPGHCVEMKSGGGLILDRHLNEKCFVFEGRKVRKLGLVAGGSGVAPMLQIIRAALKSPYREGLDGVRLIYAAESQEELTYESVLKRFQAHSGGKFSYTVVLNSPPAGWTGGVGFVDAAALRAGLYPPAEDHLIAICGPPVMQRIVKKVCTFHLNHDPALVRTVDEQPRKSKL